MNIREDKTPDGTTRHLIDGKGLCELLKISPAMITELVQRGVAVRVQRNAYDLGLTVAAYVAGLREVASGRSGQPLNITEERAKLAKAQRVAVEQKTAVAAGKLIDAEEVVRGWSDTLRKVRGRILAVASRMRQQEHLTAAQHNALDRELRDALTELAGGE